MIQLDFLNQLRNTVESRVTLPSDIERIGLNFLKETNSVSIMLIPGGEETMFMDGTRDKTHNLAVLVRHPNDKACFDLLTDIYRVLENIDDIPSANGSYEFVQVKTANLPNKQGVDDKGYNIWGIDLSITINIYKGVEI